MPYWMFDVVALALPSALLLLGVRTPRRLWWAVVAMSVVALVWTAPWDDYLVRSGIWSYDPRGVLARLGNVPVEECAFVVLLVVLVAAWGARTGRLPGRVPAADVAHRRHRLAGVGWAGCVGWVGVAAAGLVLLLVGGHARYLGLLLVWAAPPLAVQRAIAGDLLRERRVDRAVVAVPVVLWLCVADRLALADGIWAIAPATSTGVLVLGLPLEEALFFLLTVVLVTDGLLLATDRRALSRAAKLLRLRGPGLAGAPLARATALRSTSATPGS